MTTIETKRGIDSAIDNATRLQARLATATDTDLVRDRELLHQLAVATNADLRRLRKLLAALFILVRYAGVP